jgi:hypothetical protein
MRDLIAHECGNASFQFQDCADGLIEYCEAYNNSGDTDAPYTGAADAISFNGKAGQETRYSRRCTARYNVGHHISDDGFDGFSSQDCILHDNTMYAIGFAPDGEWWTVRNYELLTAAGRPIKESDDGRSDADLINNEYVSSGGNQSKGIKLGGGATAFPYTGGHLVYNNLSFYNKGTGFGWNGAEIPIKCYNNTALWNGLEGFETYNADGAGMGYSVSVTDHKLYNNIGMGNGHLQDQVDPSGTWGDYNPKGDTVDHQNNSWNIGYGTFEKTSSEWSAGAVSDPTQAGLFADLSLDTTHTPTNWDTFATLASGSPFVDAGLSLDTSVYPGAHNDLGAFELGEASSGGGSTPPSDPGDGTSSSGDGPLKVYNGTNFVIPSRVMVWNGTEWIESEVKLYDGATFESVFTSEQVRFVDSFESGGLASWSVADPEFSVTSDAPVTQGTFSVKNSGLGTGVEIVSLPGDGLANYPVAGDSFSLKWYLTDGANNRCRVAWGVQGASYSPLVGYDVELDPRGDDFIIRANHTDGTIDKLAQTTLDLSAYSGQWITVRVDWGADGVMPVTLLDDAGSTIVSLSNSAQPDTTFTGGGVAIQANDTAAMAWDDFRLL